MRAFGRLPSLAFIAVFFLTIEITAANYQLKNAEKDDIEFEWDSQHSQPDQNAVEPSLLDRVRRSFFDPLGLFDSASSTTQTPPSNLELQPDQSHDQAGENYYTTVESFRQNEPTNDDEEGDSYGSGDEHRKPVPVVPTLPGTEKTIRVTFVVMEPYVDDFSDHNSQKFQNLARSLNENVNGLYDTIPGEQRSSLVRIESRPSDGVTCKVTMDVVTVDNYDIERIVDILRRRIQNSGRLGNYTVFPDEFSYQEFNGPFLDPDIGNTDSRLQCQENEIQCESGCIAYVLQCNGNNDCPDGSDEKNCDEFDPIDNDQSEYTEPDWNEISESPVTDSTLFETYTRVDPVQTTTDESRCPNERELLACDNSNVYICNSQRCDGNRDCPEGDDELGCGKQYNDDRTEDEYEDRTDEPTDVEEPLQCRDEELPCDQTRCVPKSQLCDGNNDCTDNTDEINCTAFNCSGFFCSSGLCLPSSAKCNGVFECPNNDDESGCPCRSDEYRCGDGECIERRRVCDKVRNCRDGSDEEHCEDIDVAKPWSGAYACFRRHHFRCKSSECIPMRLRCDGYPNCLDKSDERKCPCRLDQWQCDSGECISRRKRCNGMPDCRKDHSDERHCYAVVAAAASLFKCDDGTKISSSLKCNRVYDCPDYSDERNCPCGIDDFKCRNGHCIPAKRRCDGTNDCQDRTDELSCPERSCMLSEFACTIGDCVDKNFRCDGKRDCPDGSDEFHCLDLCGLDAFHCSNATCVDIARRCNGFPDCPNGEDEYNCGRACAHGDWKCSDGTCVKLTTKCDGYPDCPDSSDERDCPALAKVPCAANEFPCSDGQCLPNSERCNGRPACSQGEDEEGCPLPESCYFQCESDGTCISRDEFCDGQPNCRDGSDEDCDCQPDDFKCDNKQCIPSYLKCDGANDCEDNSDEYNCVNNNLTSTMRPASECSRDEFRCLTDGNCIQLDFRCDKNYDCNDRSDEENCGQYFNCDTPNIYCDGVCHPETITCDGKTQCSDQRDEKNCNGEICPADKAQCSDGSCIPATALCDHVRDCSDGSDEERCGDNDYITTRAPHSSNADCLESQFTCSDGNCIPHVRRCDNVYDCSDFSDEQKCYTSDECQDEEWRCISGECIRNSYRCDGRLDCADGSDEASPTCPEPTTRRPFPTEQPYYPTFEATDSPYRPPYESPPYERPPYEATDSPFRLPLPPQPTEKSSWIPPPGSESQTSDLKLRTYPSNQTVKTSGDVVFHCRDEGPLRAKVKWSKLDGPLPSNSSDVRGRLEMNNIDMSAAGIYICQAIGFRKNLPGVEVSVELNVEQYEPPQSRLAFACHVNEATCSNGDCIPKSSICDGKYDCTDGIDEEACNIHSLCEPNEYKCANKRCILRTWLCDSEDDCQDGSDELECRAPLPGEVCHPYEFQCTRNDQCIPKSFHCNGLIDCIDGSDELGCRMVVVIEPPPMSRILEQYDTLNISCRAIGIPTPEVVWRRNWGHIPDKCTSTNYKGFSTLICPNIQVEDSGAYSCEAINIKGSLIPNIDTILQVRPKKTGAICEQGYFNSEAKTSEECISCFCFGVTSECKSADLFVFQLPTQIGQGATRLVGVAEVPVKLFEVTDEPISDNFDIVLNYNMVTVNRIGPWSPKNLHPYIILPQDYNGNHLTSYGGYLMYRKNDPRAASIRRVSSQLPDIILQGNGLQLIANTRLSYLPQHSGKYEVRLFPREWKRITPNGPQKATRQDLMVLLSNVSSIMIRAEDEGNGLSIADFSMDSAGPTVTDIGASFVEECRCPEGYTGLSCQKCASGYTKERTNGVINRCVPQAAVCEPGTYGDPQIGVPCKPCPCPHSSPTNQFARTCHLGYDQLPTCDCASGYEGRRCEVCSDGYVGNPTVPGDFCRPYKRIEDAQCDPRGTENNVNDNKCTCKPLATGERCDQCDSKAFYLSQQNPNGCIECFCGGVSKSCDSSTLRRSTISINLNPSSSVDYARVVLRPPNTLHIVETNISTQLRNRELLALDVDGRASGPYYWELPQSFTGNKLSAYGGFINYTIRHVATPGSRNFPNTAPDLELVTETFGNLLYYDPRPPSYDGIKSGQVQLVEKYWQSIVGGPVPRQEFLTILSNLNYVLVKATYTTSTSEAALISASMDIAERDGKGERAWLVEECRCPIGYVGLTCEKCSTGYTRDDTGLHFGNCVPCSCNGHSEQCHPETGECYNCADNFAGKNCEECAPGYYMLDGVCSLILQNTGSCRCDEAGSRGCHNGECECKTNVVGEQCNQCRPGTFNLQPWNFDGCKPCYCSGVSQSCQQAYGWRREQIPTVIVPNGPHEFILIAWENKKVIRTGFQAKSELNQISYEFGDLSRRETYYWSLPTAFTGDKITSYGGNLTITQKFESPYDRLSSDGLDVILVGDQKTIFWSRSSRQPVNQTFSNVVTFREEFWNIIPGSGDLKPIAHYDFMGVLGSLRQVLVRATLSTSTRRTFISDISMDTAIQSENGGSGENQALDVEVCTCPPGYLGTSCELCANLHYRDEQGQCSACPCQDNARGCSLDRNGQLVCDCIPPYSGYLCKNIDSENQELTPKPSFWDPKISAVITNRVLDIQVGKSAHWSCQSRGYDSNAPVKISWRREGGNMPYERVIEDTRTGDLTIYDVEESDSGTYICEAFDGIAYATERAVLTVSGNPPTIPEVRIEPSFVEVNEGEPIELTCHATGNPAPKLSWLRADRRSIAPYYLQEGVFRIEAARDADKGEYRCIAQNTEGSGSAVSVIYIKPRGSFATGVPRLITSPSSELMLAQGASGIIHCIAEHTTIDSRLIAWTRENGELPRTFTPYGDELRIVQAQPRDSGVYQCYINSLISPATILVSVQAIYEDTTPAPDDQSKVNVDKERVTLPEGESIVINCTASGNPYPTIRWRKGSGRLGEGAEQRGDSLVIANAKMSDADLYICEGLSYDGTPITQAPSYVTITRREKPRIEIWPTDQMQIKIGEGAALRCTIQAGIPEPNVTWSRGDGMPFSPRTILEPGNVIRIHNATLNDEAQYICTVSNEAGTAVDSRRVVVVADPVISIYPDSYIVASIGQELNVECRVKGYPQPTVTWRKESDHIGTNEVYGARLHIPRVKLSDSGTYTCIASNSASTREESIMINVDEVSNGYEEVTPRGAHIGATPLSYHAVEGGPAQLKCSATPRDPRNNRPYRIDWVRSDGSPLPPTARITNNVLAIDKVSVADAGEYQCRLLVDGKTQVVVKSTLAVDRLPTVTLRPVRQIVRPGDTVNLRCDATGDEPITLRWRPQFGDFPSRVQVRGSRGESLVFYQIEVQDAGEYICEATNYVGTATATATVVVRETITKHHITATSRTQRAEWGETVSLACDGEGQAARIRWYRENGALPSKAKQSLTGVLTLTKVHPSDSGRYVCRLEHDSGTTTQDYVDLIVNADEQIPDPKVVITAPASPTLAGDNLKVDCRATSSDIDVSWYGLDNAYYYNQQKYGGRSTLLLDDVSQNQAGVYYCRGQDSGSNVYSDVFSLVVQSTPALIRNASDQVLHAPLGSRIIMPCVTTLDGQLQYEWRRPNGYIPLTIDSTQPQVEIFEVSERDAGAYICRVSNGRINMETKVVLKVTNVVPQFNGDSYIALPTLRDVYREFNIEVDIKPLHGYGIMLYISEKPGRDPGDMISLALVDGFPEFKFDTGNGPVTVRGDKRLHLDQWHNIKINRKDKDGYMYVDGNGPFAGSSNGRYNMVNFIKQPLYIGGVPDYNKLSAEFVNRTGYLGCISRLVLGDQEISLMSRKYNIRRNIENCDSCDPNPCQSGGVCQEFLNERGYMCLCAEGFSGTNCSRVGAICLADMCGPGRCHESDQGIKCICPIGYVGERCEERRDIEYPGFSGGAYLAYKLIVPNLHLKLRLQVKPSSPLQDGIIMYASENRYGHGGFVALVVKDRHVEFRIDTGAEFVILRSISTLRENVWTDVSISRVLDRCILKINGQDEDQQILRNRSKNLKLGTPMYVGGFDDDLVTINNKTDVFVGFNGCVKDVSVQGKALDIVKSSFKAANVQECNVSNKVPHRGDIPVPTEYETGGDCSRCVHGECRLQSTSCTCDYGYEGRFCDVGSLDLYKRAVERCEAHPCGDGGTCEPTQEGTYRCNCHLGYSGFHCQTPILIRGDFQLNGNAYVELPASLIDRDMELIALAFTNRLDDGVLIYQGGDRHGDQQDFILLTIEHGLIKLEWELGSGVGKLIHKTFVSDGKRHQLVVLRRGREMQLTVDNEKIIGYSPGIQTELNVKSNIYVGGVPNEVHNGSLHGLTGCVEQIEFGTGPINIAENAVSSKNIVPCNNSEANEIGSDHQF